MLPSWLASFNFFQHWRWLSWNFLCVNCFGRLFWLLPLSFVWRVCLNKDWFHNKYGLLNHWNSVLFLLSSDQVEFSCGDNFMRNIRLPSFSEFLEQLRNRFDLILLILAFFAEKISLVNSGMLVNFVFFWALNRGVLCSLVRSLVLILGCTFIVEFELFFGF